jgi:hypothetical protein
MRGTSYFCAAESTVVCYSRRLTERCAEKRIEDRQLTDIQAATDIEVLAAAGNLDDTTDELSLAVIVFAVVAFGSEAVWLGLIGWWLLNLF